MNIIKIFLLFFLILFSSTACFSPKGPGGKVLAQKFGEPYQGVRSSPPELAANHERLDIFLGVPVEVKEGEERLEEGRKFKKIIYCIAINEDKRPLPEVFKLIEKTPADKLIYIWGEPVTAKKGFWWDGVDCTALAIGVWHMKAERYLYYDLVYKDGIRWRGLLKHAVEKGAKAGFKAVTP